VVDSKFILMLVLSCFVTFCLLFGLFAAFILGLTINQVAITCLKADVS